MCGEGQNLIPNCAPNWARTPRLAKIRAYQRAKRLPRSSNHTSRGERLFLGGGIDKERKNEQGMQRGPPVSSAPGPDHLPGIRR